MNVADTKNITARTALIFIKIIFHQIIVLAEERRGGKRNKPGKKFCVRASILAKGSSMYEDNEDNEDDEGIKLLRSRLNQLGSNNSFLEYLENGTELYGWNTRKRTYQAAVFLLDVQEKTINKMINTAIISGDIYFHPNRLREQVELLLDIIPKDHNSFDSYYYKQKLLPIIPFILGKYLFHVRRSLLMTTYDGEDSRNEDSEKMWKKFRQVLVYLDYINKSNLDTRRKYSDNQYQDLFSSTSVNKDYDDEILKIENVERVRNLFRLRTNLLKPLVDIILSYLVVEPGDEEVEKNLHTRPFFQQDSSEINLTFSS
jgi:hypothetical protein